MSFIQDLGNNKPLSSSRKRHDINFIKENKEEIKSIFEEIKEDAKAKAEERKESKNPLLLGLTNCALSVFNVPSLFDYIGAAMKNEDLKELVGEYKDSTKANTENWLKDETLIGDIANTINKDKNIEAEG